MPYTRQQFLLLLLPTIVRDSRLFAENQGDEKQTVEAFLKQWLVDRQAKSAMRFFHSKAFTSKLILSDSCLGKLGDADRKSPRKVKLAVGRFLREVINWSKGKSLQDRLKTFELTNVELKSADILASPDQDGYLLARGKNLEVETDENWQYLKSSFPSEEYLFVFSMMRIRDRGGKEKTEAPIYSIWALEGKNWRIIHFGLGCI